MERLSHTCRLRSGVGVASVICPHEGTVHPGSCRHPHVCFHPKVETDLKLTGQGIRTRVLLLTMFLFGNSSKESKWENFTFHRKVKVVITYLDWDEVCIFFFFFFTWMISVFHEACCCSWLPGVPVNFLCGVTMHVLLKRLL